MKARIDWFDVGKDHWEGNQDRLMAICKAADWTNDRDVAMMPGMGINAVIKEMKMPKVTEWAIMNDLAPYGLYGIRAHYKNADVDLFVVDEGTHISPLCAFVTEKPKCVCLTVDTVETRVAVA